MAEVAGLAIGAAALLGVFNDCLDILSRISAIRSMARDAQILNTKLDIEKTLFLQWADRVGLLKPSCDERLRNAAIANPLEKVLNELHTLLSDSSNLQHRYGLQEKGLYDAAASTSVISGGRMARFTAAFDRLAIQRRAGIERVPSGPSLAAKIQWVAVHKEKMERLVDDLAYFVAKLNELVPPNNNNNSQASMADEDITGLNSLETLGRLMGPEFHFRDAAPESHLLRAAKLKFEEFCKDRILRTLWFRKMDDRKQCISPAHSQTLKWALNPIAVKEKCYPISEWFRQDSGFYWISGKAGCGKSTLMRHLYEDPTTTNLLREWAADMPLITPHFFFYQLGAPEQRTFGGLTRTLLYQILRTDTSLIPELLPDMWKEALGLSHDQPLDLPTRAETWDAFKRICRKPARICFFIDGLDEYSGDQREAISFLKLFSNSKGLKVLVSSRPEPDFIAILSHGPMLQMQDLTEKDIELYVKDTVGSHPRFQALMRRKGLEARAGQIIIDLIGKAEGIFLWIVLACQSVMTGVTKGDRIPELERRVAELPKELGDMFAFMLSKVEERYQRQCARYLRICYESHTSKFRHCSVPTAALSVLDEYHENLMGCSVLNQPSAEDMEQMCTALYGRLGSRCGGLLEIRLKPSGSSFLTWTIDQDSQCYDPIVNSEVTFIHRTVVEFLESGTSWDIPGLNILDEPFDPRLSLSCLSMYKAQFTRHSSLIDTSIMFSLWYAESASKEVPNLLLSVFQDIQDIMLALKPKLVEHYIATSPTSHGADLPSDIIHIVLAVELGRSDVLQYRSTQRSDQLLHKRLGHFPLLYHATAQIVLGSFSGFYPATHIKPSAAMVRYLLKTGCPATESFLDLTQESMTPWLSWIGLMESNFSKPSDVEMRVRITEAYITESVDKQAVISSTRRRSAKLRPILQSALVEFEVPSNTMLEAEEVDLRRVGLEMMQILFGEDCDFLERGGEISNMRSAKRRRLE